MQSQAQAHEHVRCSTHLILYRDKNTYDCVQGQTVRESELQVACIGEVATSIKEQEMHAFHGF